MGQKNKIDDFHPLKGLYNTNNIFTPRVDPVLQGDVNLQGDIQPGSAPYNRLDHLGLAEDVLPTVQFFGKSIAAGAVGGAMGAGADAAAAGSTGADLEAVGTSAGGVGETGATGVTQAQAASLPASETEALGSGAPQMPAATPEPAGGPTAPGGSAGPDATMPAAVPEPQGGPTAPGGSAETPPSATTPSQPNQQSQTTKSTETPKPKLFDTIKTAANILTPVSTLLALASGQRASRKDGTQSNNAPPPAPPPPELPVSGSGKGPLSAPIVERSIIQGQAARRGRASTILTNPSDSDSRLGG